MQICALLTRSQCKVFGIQVTVKACGPFVLEANWFFLFVFQAKYKWKSILRHVGSKTEKGSSCQMKCCHCYKAPQKNRQRSPKRVVNHHTYTSVWIGHPITYPPTTVHFVYSHTEVYSETYILFALKNMFVNLNSNLHFAFFFSFVSN